MALLLAKVKTCIIVINYCMIFRKLDVRISFSQEVAMTTKLEASFKNQTQSWNQTMNSVQFFFLRITVDAISSLLSVYPKVFSL